MTTERRVGKRHDEITCDSEQLEQLIESWRNLIGHHYAFSTVSGNFLYL